MYTGCASYIYTTFKHVHKNNLNLIMKKAFVLLTAFIGYTCIRSHAQSQTLQDVTTNGNTTPNAIKITGFTNLPTTAVEGLELYYQNGTANVNSFNRGTGARLPMNLNASSFNFYSNRFYYTNRIITGTSEDGQGPNYILLHKAYTSTLIADGHVMGKITGIRGTAGAWNRKLTVEVNTSSAYNTNRGSLICYNEGARLVTVTYNSETYLAIEMLNASAMSFFSFTGYAANETLLLVKDDDVTNVLEYTPTDAVNIQGRLALGYFGGGLPVSKLDIMETVGTKDNMITVRNSAITNSRLIIGAAGSAYGVTNHANNSVIESYNDLHLSAALTGKVYFETGRTGASSPVKMILTNTGSLVIAPPTNDYNYTLAYKLAVNGAAIFTKVVVKNFDNWADYVFAPSYRLMPLNQLEQYLQKNRHLPDVPSAAVVEKEGIDIGSNQVTLLKKIEELTLYVIQQNKQIEVQKQEHLTQQQQLEAKNKALEEKLKQIEKKLDLLLQ